MSKRLTPFSFVSQDGSSVPLSQHFHSLLTRLAAAHPSTKFLSIPAGLCIPNYPDKNVPTLLIYRNGELSGNVVAGAGLNGMKTSVRGAYGSWWNDAIGRLNMWTGRIGEIADQMSCRKRSVGRAEK